MAGGLRAGLGGLVLLAAACAGPTAGQPAAPASAPSSPAALPTSPSAGVERVPFAPTPPRLPLRTVAPPPTRTRLALVTPLVLAPTPTPVPSAADLWVAARRSLAAMGGFRYVVDVRTEVILPGEGQRRNYVQLQGTYRDPTHWHLALYHLTEDATFEWVATGGDEGWHRRDRLWERVPLSRLQGERDDVETRWVWSYMTATIGNHYADDVRSAREAGEETMWGVPSLRFESESGPRRIWDGSVMLREAAARLWIARAGGFLVAAELEGAAQHRSGREDRWRISLRNLEVGREVAIVEPAERPLPTRRRAGGRVR